MQAKVNKLLLTLQSFCVLHKICELAEKCIDHVTPTLQEIMLTSVTFKAGCG